MDVKPRQLLRPQLHLQLQRPRPEGSNTNHPKLPALHETRKRKAMIIPPKCAAQRTRPERSSPTLSRQNSASSACTGEDLAARNLPAPVGKEGKAANVKAAACGPPTAMKTNNGRACQAPLTGNASVTRGIWRHSQTSTSAVDPPWRNDGTPQNVQIPPQPKAPQPKGRCQPPLRPAASPPWRSATPLVKQSEVVLRPRAEGPRPDAHPPKFVPAGKAPDWQQSSKRPAASKHVPAPKLSVPRPKPSAASILAKQRAVLSPGPLSGVPITTPAPCDNEGRPFDLQRVVVNFANVGSTYGDRVLKRDKRKQTLMDYEGVRRCLQHLTQKRRLNVIGVVYENFKAVNEFGKEFWSPPKDIEAMCESIQLTPRVTGTQHKSADDEMTIKCAYNRNCRFLDNDNYADWLHKMPNQVVRKWLESCQEFLQMRFYFDSGLGTFEILDGNLPAAALATRVSRQARGTSQASSA